VEERCNNLLHIENRKRYSMVQAENLETGVGWCGGVRRRTFASYAQRKGKNCRNAQKTQRWRQELPKNK
jgi:hypothetical protein